MGTLFAAVGDDPGYIDDRAILGEDALQVCRQLKDVTLLPHQ